MRGSNTEIKKYRTTSFTVFTLHHIRFICGLFNDAVSSSDYIAPDDRMINELEMIWKEMVVA
jgi:hypothetical protein